MTPKKYIIEHMEEDLHEWCKLEYDHIIKFLSPTHLYFTNLSHSIKSILVNTKLVPETNLFTNKIWDYNNIFLGDDKIADDDKNDNDRGRLSKDKICLLDPNSNQLLEPSDGELFEYFLFGGILGDDPPRDRTSELRILNFQTRNLGNLQMTTDTAIHVTKRIVEDKVHFSEIPFIDFPEIKLSNQEFVVMPFRYIAISDSSTSTLQTTNNELKQNIIPLLPDRMIELLKKEGDKAFD
ncbi:hypothetical protein Glove_272g39 [Diversispora epigaea]|uniref:SAM-dependent RNA methyltransferase n=1 Tax=Diversispora epigaea TaxID=1348612 RepID=A0A397IB33_9GLOM|nr:hypothetical protein Glove_272g39 [Diversispora epigaea]